MSGDPAPSELRLAVDFGTTMTAAAIAERRCDLISFDGAPAFPSAVLLGNDGELVAGSSVTGQLLSAGERIERTPKRRLGDPGVLLGDESVDPVDLAAATIRRAIDEARRRMEGREPDVVRLTHPARWASRRLGLLSEAGRRAGAAVVELVPEPVAAAMHLADADLPDGSLVAVFDFGGGTLDVCVLRREDGAYRIAGPPGGNDRLGGETLDDLLYHHLGGVLARSDAEAWEQLRYSDERQWQRLNQQFRESARAAKEALSVASEHTVYLSAPVDAELHVSRVEFEELIRPEVERAGAEFAAVLSAAGVEPADLSATFLVGGSSRIPMVSRVIGDLVGKAPVTKGDPKGVVAMGAAELEDSEVGTSAITARVAAVPLAASEGTDSDDATAVDEPRSRRAPVILGAAALLVAVVVGAAFLLVGGGGDTPPPPDPEVLGENETAEGTDEPPPGAPVVHELGTQVLTNGATANVTWSFDDETDELSAGVIVGNPTAAEVTTVHLEAVPKEVAATASEVGVPEGFPEFTVVEDDPVIAWELVVPAGGEVRVGWVVGDVADSPDAAQLEAWATEGLALVEPYRLMLATELCSRVTCADAAAGIEGAEVVIGADGTASLVDSSTGETLVPVITGGTGTGSTGSTGTGGTGSTGTGSTGTGSSGGGTGTGSTGGGTSPVVTAAPTTAKPPPVSVPSAPQNVRTTGVSGAACTGWDTDTRSVSLAWSPPASNGGAAVTGYTVTAAFIGAGGVLSTQSANVSGTSANISIPRLQDQGYWRWTVAAVNSAGAGSATVANVTVVDRTGCNEWIAVGDYRALGAQAVRGFSVGGGIADRVAAQGPTSGTVGAGSAINYQVYSG